jgi:hypothetical protein
MVYYDTIHAGILRISFNEQYLWLWFRKNNKIPPLQSMEDLSHLVEGRLNEWNWNKPMILNELISTVYYKFTHAEQKD